MKTGENSENKYSDIKVGPDMYGHGQQSVMNVISVQNLEMA